MLKRSTMVVVLVLLSCSFLFGCKNSNNSSQKNERQNEFIEQTKTRNYESKDERSNKDIASHLANIATEVKDVNDAVALVVGPYAVVGIDVDKNLDRQRVGTIKYSVTEALRNDKYGKTAVVIADADLMERVRQMGIDIQKGRPVRGIIEELAEIVNRYVPDLPVEQDKYKDDNENDSLNKQNKEKLKDIQEKQSKDH